MCSAQLMRQRKESGVLGGLLTGVGELGDYALTKRQGFH